MQTENPDVLVIGLGAMGAATIYQLAKRGVNVVGIDQYTPPHVHGSTHGETRITRQATGEGLQFVPLAMRSHQLWREIEDETGAELYNACGGLILVREGRESRMHEQRDFLGTTLNAAETFNIPHERLAAADIVARFPQFVLQGDERAYFEPTAGYLAPEACVRAQLALAKQRGAEMHFGETVRSIVHANGKSTVETDRARYTPGVTIVAAGAWVPQLLPALATTLTVRRQVLFWFARDATGSRALSYKPDAFPIFIWHWGGGDDEVFYGFPEIDASGAIKLATEQIDADTTPQTVRRDVSATESAAVHAQHVAGRLRSVSSNCVKSATCLYTNAPAANFMIDRLPDAPDTIVVSACSGHGFKHSAAIGEAVAMMAVDGETPEILLPFKLRTTA
ncbi:MAG: N-methyl-L-tryptophan oxidase [Usitatibacteraceae bacterium]